VRRNSFSRSRLALGEIELRLPPRVGLGQDRTISPVRGWPWARQNNISRLELASGETEQHLPSEVILGRDGIASLDQGCPQVRQNNVSHPRLASGEMDCVSMLIRTQGYLSPTSPRGSSNFLRVIGSRLQK
jgi:hypothetical protein